MVDGPSQAECCDLTEVLDRFPAVLEPSGGVVDHAQPDRDEFIADDVTSESVRRSHQTAERSHGVRHVVAPTVSGGVGGRWLAGIDGGAFR